MLHSMGIIAGREERVEKCRWYNFIKKTKAECIVNEQLGVKFIIAYDNQKVSRIFKKEGISVAAVSSKCAPVQIDDIYIVTGDGIYYRHLPYAIKKISKELSGAENDDVIAIIDDHLGTRAVTLINKLQQSFRYITIVTDNMEKAKTVSDNLMDEYGIAITILPMDEKIACNIAVNFSQKPCDLPDYAVIFDKPGEHNMRNTGRVINNFAIAPKIKLPAAVKNTAVIEGIEAMDIWHTDYLPTGLLYDDTPVNLF